MKEDIEIVFNNAIKYLTKVRDNLCVNNFTTIINIIHDSSMIWASGVGKAGLAAKKLVSTLASNHKPAAYLDASNALHGDIGAVQKTDCIVVLSNSGRTEEMFKILSRAKEIGIISILITGNGDALLGSQTDNIIDYGIIEEACPLKLTPTTSSMVMTAIVDAIAIATQRRLKLTYKDYYNSHHSGYLGELARRHLNEDQQDGLY